MFSNLNGSGSVRVQRKYAVFTGSRFRFGFGSTPCVEAEAGSGGSGHILMEAEAQKICRFRFHIIQKSIL